MAQRLPVWCWPACLIGAWPLAWAVSHAGFGIAIAEPWRQAGWLALGSIAEEIVFRGGLQHALLRASATERRIGSISAANALTSLAFAAFHLWNHPPLAAIGVLPVSLLLGWVYERGGQRIAPPALLHLYFNATLFAVSLAARPL